MELNPTTIGVLIAVWIVGYLLGLLEAAIKNDRQAKKETEKEADQAAPSDIAEKEKTDDEAVLPPEILEPEVLTIYQRISGALKLRLDGEVVEYSSDLTEEQRERLLALVVALRPWLEKKEPKKPTEPLPPIKAPTPTRTVSIATTTVAPAPDAEVKTTSGLSMVEQIDRILQTKLETSPLGKRGIMLRSSLSGSLLIRVGLDEYEWVDDIPEAEIQAIIREAIAEWEENATP